MNNCKGRGKNEEDISIVFPPPPTTTAVVLVASNVATTTYSKPSPSFAGSFRQVFDSRRGMFEKKNIGNEILSGGKIALHLTNEMTRPNSQPN